MSHMFCSICYLCAVILLSKYQLSVTTIIKLDVKSLFLGPHARACNSLFLRSKSLDSGGGY